MAPLSKKRTLGTVEKYRVEKRKTKRNDSHTDILDAKIRSANHGLWLLNDLYKSHLLIKVKKDKKTIKVTKEERIMRKILRHDRPLPVEFSSPEIKKTKPNVGLNFQDPTHEKTQIPQNSLRQSNAQLPGASSCFDQDYRRKSPLSTVHVPVHDLLPSPALLWPYSNVLSEGSKYLQESALLLVDAFIKSVIDKKVTCERIKKTDDIPNFCFVCNVDYSSVWVPLIHRKSQFICEKCNAAKKRKEMRNIDLLNYYGERRKIEAFRKNRTLPMTPNLVGNAVKPKISDNMLPGFVMPSVANTTTPITSSVSITFGTARPMSKQSYANPKPYAIASSQPSTSRPNSNEASTNVTPVKGLISTTTPSSASSSRAGSDDGRVAVQSVPSLSCLRMSSASNMPTCHHRSSVVSHAKFPHPPYHYRPSSRPVPPSPQTSVTRPHIYQMANVIPLMGVSNCFSINTNPTFSTVFPNCSPSGPVRMGSFTTPDSMKPFPVTSMEKNVYPPRYHQNVATSQLTNNGNPYSTPTFQYLGMRSIELSHFSHTENANVHRENARLPRG